MTEGANKNTHIGTSSRSIGRDCCFGGANKWEKGRHEDKSALQNWRLTDWLTFSQSHSLLPTDDGTATEGKSESGGGGVCTAKREKDSQKEWGKKREKVDVDGLPSLCSHFLSFTSLFFYLCCSKLALAFWSLRTDAKVEGERERRRKKDIWN